MKRCAIMQVASSHFDNVATDMELNFHAENSYRMLPPSLAEGPDCRLLSRCLSLQVVGQMAKDIPLGAEVGGYEAGCIGKVAERGAKRYSIYGKPFPTIR